MYMRRTADTYTFFSTLQKILKITSTRISCLILSNNFRNIDNDNFSEIRSLQL